MLVLTDRREAVGQPVPCGGTGCDVCSGAGVQLDCCCGHGRLHLCGVVLSFSSISSPCSTSLLHTAFLSHAFLTFIVKPSRVCLVNPLVQQ